MRSSVGRLWTGWICMLLAVACGGRMPTTHYYLLEPAAVASSTAAGGEISIGVRPFAVDPPYDQDRIVHRVGEASPEIGFYDYHRWAAPLTRMLPSVVASSFSELAGLASIEPAAPGKRYAYALTGRLLSLSEIGLSEGQRVEVRLELKLHDASGVEIWSAMPSHATTVSTESVERIVVEMRAVIHAALSQAYPSLYTRLALLHEAESAATD